MYIYIYICVYGSADAVLRAPRVPDTPCLCPRSSPLLLALEPIQGSVIVTNSVISVGPVETSHASVTRLLASPGIY